MAETFCLMIKQRGTFSSTFRHEGVRTLTICVLLAWIFSEALNSIPVAIGISLISSSALFYAALLRRRDTISIRSDDTTLYINDSRIDIRSISEIELNASKVFGNRVKIGFKQKVMAEQMKPVDYSYTRSRTYWLLGLDDDQIQCFMRWISNVISNNSSDPG